MSEPVRCGHVVQIVMVNAERTKTEAVCVLPDGHDGYHSAGAIKASSGGMARTAWLIW